MQQLHAPSAKTEGRLKDNKHMHVQFDDVCSSIDFQLRDHGCGYPKRGTPHRSYFNGEINDKPGRTNGKTSTFF
ncbi:hypothetical protein TNCV_1535261 [Trichonephila clavipes]|uniref:Uncharacterized protein n=1 Tax=Trichonephila clavipes TaxID=2585209 RepID=A0A8X6V1M9_TRICX|nr:hypothetical protein TNCV_1535261 [Trichonephila clavipes]